VTAPEGGVEGGRPRGVKAVKMGYKRGMMTGNAHQCNYSIRTAGFSVCGFNNGKHGIDDDVQERRAGEKHVPLNNVY